MSQPTPGDVYVSTALTNVSLAYSQDEKVFIADRMFPVIPSPQQGGVIFEWDLEYLLRNEMGMRAPNAPSRGAGLKLNQKTYFALVHALHHDVSDQRRANETSPINADRAATLLLTQQAIQYREITMKGKAFASGKWTGFTDGTGVAGAPGVNQIKQWDQSASTPVKDVKTLATALKLSTGVRPNKIGMGQQVWDALMYNPDVIDRIKYGQTAGSPAMVTKEAVAALFGLDEILVSDVTQVTSNEGAAAVTSGFVIGKEFVLFYTPPVGMQDVETPSAGYTLTWNGYMGATGLGTRMKKFRMEANAADRIEIEQAYEQNLLAPKLGGYYSTVVA